MYSVGMRLPADIPAEFQLAHLRKWLFVDLQGEHPGDIEMTQPQMERFLTLLPPDAQDMKAFRGIPIKIVDTDE